MKASEHSETTVLTEHFSHIRESPLQKPSTLSDARYQLQRALQAAWHIGNAFGQTWSYGVGRPGIDANAGRSEKARRGAYNMPAPRVVNPVDFGADPTGKEDSTEAMKQAMAVLLNSTGLTARPMANAIIDLGGVALDLAGGQYLISEPLVFLPGFGNAGIKSGTLRASSSFPRDKWMIMIGAHAKNPCMNAEQGCCNQFINLEDMMLDAAHVAAGCVSIAYTLASNIGPDFFCTGFHDAGVYISKGHENMLQHAWFAEYYWTEVTKEKQRNSHSVGVRLDGNDNVLSNVIVFRHTHIGVEVLKSVNVLQNVHTWNGGGVGIMVNATLARLTSCYLDWNKLLVLDPSELVVENSLFLDTNVELRSEKRNHIDGVRFYGNSYATTSNWNPIVSSVEIDPRFSGGSIDMSDELSRKGKVPLKLTRARRSLFQKDSKRWEFDFSDVLLLPQIEEVQYSFISDSDSDFVRHVARTPKGRHVAIETDVLTTGTVTVEVSQGKGVFFLPR